jgi:phenol 2-monooxygenase (NADPH)
MMDSYNLSWKLAHTLHNLIPISKRNENPVMDTFESERLNVARQLIDFDSKFSSMFSGQIGGDDASVQALTHEEFVKVFEEGSGFTSGCGIEYGDSVLVKHTRKTKEGPVTSNDPLNGTLHAGRRISDVRVRRYADANLRHLQDGMYSLRCPQIQMHQLMVTCRFPVYWTLSPSRFGKR